ncbi:zinc finger protein 16-like [Scophthalmus maximus]|uniref:zinc finger protein 16-like n=1 Tax=Scophthalmus maximus TaxID=52904 RepID=UPI001FA89010|nr:zinc finger protein 16-like [Scophthalmus maximus]
MSAGSGRALREHLSVILGALTKAAVAEICELVDEGYAVLQLEISRSHKENEALRKKLHLIESIVVRGGGGGEGEGAQRPDGDGGDAVVLREELPEVVLIKDEDSDSDDAFEDDNRPSADRGTAATREAVVATPGGRGLKRRSPGNEEAAEKKSSSSFEQLTLKPSKLAAGMQQASVADSSPRSEPGCSGPLGGDEMEVCSYDPDVVHLVRQEGSPVSPRSARQTYFGNSALMECRSPPGRAELDLVDVTWTKQTKSQMSFPSFHQIENVDVDAFGLKMISVSGSTSTDLQLSESSNSAFEYEDADAMNFALYRDPSGRAECAGARGRRFVCSLCSKSYATSQNLDVHMRIHTGERPFSCSQCGKTFTQSAHLKSHLSVHSGERPYACAFCSRSFIVKYSLKLHVKKCHPDARE